MNLRGPLAAGSAEVAARAAASLASLLAFLGITVSAASPVYAQHAGAAIGLGAAATLEAAASSTVGRTTGSTTSGVADDLRPAASRRDVGVGTRGIWVDPAQIMAQPTSGAAWERVLQDAERDHGQANIADQDSNHDVYTLAAALVCVRTSRRCDTARKGILDAIGTESGARWLAVGRNLGAYVIAADLLGMRADGIPDSEGTRVHEWMESWLTKELLENHSGEMRTIRPFHSGANTATQEGFAFVAVATYLRDEAALERAWNAFRTFVCDPGAPDDEHIHLEPSVHDGWTHDGRRPCAVNPSGARRTVANGLRGAGAAYSIDGALVGDMRRGGVYQWRPDYTSYPWLGLEGLVPAAVMLSRAGFPAFEAGDRAVLRTLEYLWWLRDSTGEARWFDGMRAREIVHLVNVVYHASFPVADVTDGGRTVGYTAWTHPGG